MEFVICLLFSEVSGDLYTYLLTVLFVPQGIIYKKTGYFYLSFPVRKYVVNENKFHSNFKDKASK